MQILQKIMRVYQQAKGLGLQGYFYIDEDYLNEVIYELSEFLDKKLENVDSLKFKENINDNKRKKGIEYLRAAADALNEAKHRKGVYRKMSLFDESKHWLHGASMFNGEIGEISQELHRRQKEGWF